LSIELWRNNIIMSERYNITEQTCAAYRDGILKEISSQVNKIELLTGSAHDDFRNTLGRIAAQVEVVLAKKVYDRQDIIDIFSLELSKLKLSQINTSIIDNIYDIINKQLIDFERKLKIELNPEDLKTILPDALSLSDLTGVKFLSVRQIIIIFGIVVTFIFTVGGLWYSHTETVRSLKELTVKFEKVSEDLININNKIGNLESSLSDYNSNLSIIKDNVDIAVSSADSSSRNLNNLLRNLKPLFKFCDSEPSCK